MPRKLPWLTEELKGKKSVGVSSGVSDRTREGPSSSNLQSKTRRTASTSKAKLNLKSAASRTPSTSPPPAPPSEEYMHEGWDKDDGWMMVEDEFYAIAQSFTTHLHWQEYKKLQEQVRLDKTTRRMASTGKRRPEHQRKLEAADLRARHAKALQDMAPRSDFDADEDKEDDPWVGTSLHDLMASPKKSQQSLLGLEKMKSSTKAAAGYSQTAVPQEHEDTVYGKDARPRSSSSSTYDNDLDASPSRPTREP
ncbi:MAG: hypothetical protein Q9227_005862 [Pyrenula ochraceoflavens]